MIIGTVPKTHNDCFIGQLSTITDNVFDVYNTDLRPVDIGK